MVLPAAHGQTTSYATNCVTNGANNATVLVDQSVVPMLEGGASIAAGDTLVAYTNDGLCAGYAVWNDTDDVTLSVAGPNTATSDPAKQGYESGESLKFKIYDASQDRRTDYGSNLTYTPSSEIGLPIARDDGLYTADALFKIEGFDASSLPVELTRFEAQRATGAVRLEWETATERNNAGFEVQYKGEDDGSWSALSFVKGAGTTASAESYSYTAKELEYGTYQFRLVQVDQDGSRTTKDPIEIDFTLDGAYKISKVYPNPVRQTGTLDLVVKAAQQVTVQVYDVLGRTHGRLLDRKVPAGQTTTVRIDASRFSSGQYFLRVRGETFTVTRRLTVVQ